MILPSLVFPALVYPVYKEKKVLLYCHQFFNQLLVKLRLVEHLFAQNDLKGKIHLFWWCHLFQYSDIQHYDTRLGQVRFIGLG